VQRLFTLAVIALLSCGGTQGNGNPDGGSNVVVPDTTSPSVVSMSPANGATGVASDALITIEFSEPMDQLSVQNSIDTSHPRAWVAAVGSRSIVDQAVGSG
jgi:hypothetical protein